MHLILITQDDPFFLAENISYLLDRLPDGAEVVGAVVSDVSPFGRKESFLKKAWKTWRIFGTGFFLRYAWRYLKAKLDPETSVRRLFKRRGIPIIPLAGSINSEESLARIRAYRPDLLISIAGNEIFKRPLIELAPKGCINLHTALLPKYRGLMPSFWVLRNGEEYTGVSVFYVDEGIDSGPILVQKRLRISGRTQEQLIRDTKRLGMEAIVEAVEKIRRGDTQTIPNDDAEMTYYSFPTRADVVAFRRAGARFY